MEWMKIILIYLLFGLTILFGIGAFAEIIIWIWIGWTELKIILTCIILCVLFGSVTRLSINRLLTHQLN